MKIFFLMLLILFGVCFFSSNNEDEIRVRVLSNSDSVNDLKYKEEVVKYLKDVIFIDYKLSDSSFEKNYKLIEEDLNLRFDNIFVAYENHTFRNKTYNGSALKDGNYKTLLISIGKGLGSNWWGSIFNNTLVKESTDEVKYEWYFGG